jgi:hypothetical protein
MKIILLAFLIVSSATTQALTVESKLNTAISNIASAIEDISDSKNSIIKIPVVGSLSKEMVEEIMESVATAEGIRSVGMLPISEMYALSTNKKQKFYKTYQYLDIADSMALVDYSTNLTTVFPIRIHLIEGLDGKLWLTTRDIQSIISQHQASPKYIQDILYRAKVMAQKIMNSGATGEF